MDNTPETGEVYFAVRPSRGAGVLKELLPGWNGILVCDGWRTYNMFKKMQRCWAHVTREARHLYEGNSDNPGAKHLYKWLSDIYHNAKKKRSARDRQKDHDLLSCRTRRLISKYAGDDHLRNLLTLWILQAPPPHLSAMYTPTIFVHETLPPRYESDRIMIRNYKLRP